MLRVAGVRKSFGDHVVLDGIDLGIVTTDASGTVTFVNRTARELLGVRSARGTDVRHLLGLHSLPEDLVSTTPKLAYVLPSAEGDDLDIELSVGRATGFHDVTGYYFVFRDVREEKSRSAERERFAELEIQIANLRTAMLRVSEAG